MNEYEKIVHEMNIITDECPLSLEYETNAREVWPKRWRLLKEFVKEKSGRDWHRPVKKEV